MHVRRAVAAALLGTCASVSMAACDSAPSRSTSASSTGSQIPAAETAAQPTPVTPSAPPRVHKVVGLGDSVPAGYACSCATYVSLVATRLAAAEHTQVTASNLSVPGETAAGLAYQLSQPNTLSSLAGADLVLVTVGANDLENDASCDVSSSLQCYQPKLDALETTLPQLLDGLRAHLPPHARIVITGYWNVFLDGAVARQKGPDYIRNSDALTRTVNSIISDAAGAHQATYIDVYTPFRGNGDRDDTALLAPDGDHPSPAGHQLIARVITQALLST